MDYLYFKECVLFLMFLPSSLQHRQERSQTYFPSGVRNESNETVLIRSHLQCERFEDMRNVMEPQTRYEVLLNLDPAITNCSTHEKQKGFYCHYSLQYTDEYAFTGMKLCADIQSIPKSMTDTQLMVTIFTTRETLKEVYKTTLVNYPTSPIICSSESDNYISSAISVRDSVDMCPKILGSMLNQNISLGTFMALPTVPIYSLTLERCSENVYPSQTESEYIIKVSPHKNVPLYVPSCRAQFPLPSASKISKTCLQLLYADANLNCDASVVIVDQDVYLHMMDFPDRSVVTRRQLPRCREYSVASEKQPAYLLIKRGRKGCRGGFAFKVTYKFVDASDSKGDYDHPSSDKMRHLYMAVFISLISVCLLILGLTCVCCLRMRSKRRLRRSQQRQRGERVSNANLGYDASFTEPTAPAISWSSSNPGQIYGLPSYEEICSQTQQDGNNMGEIKDEKPPLYEELYPSTS